MLRRKLLILVFIFINIQSNFAQSSNTMVVDWGDNTSSQLYLPFQNINITGVSTGYEHTIAIVDGTSIIAWGANSYGQNDVPTGITNPIKVSAGLGHSLVLQQDGTVKAWGFNDFGQIDVSSLANVIDLAAGDEHSIFLHSDGTVTVLGTNTTYDLTPPGGLTDVIAISAGNFHNLALKSDGTVVAWGANEFDQIDVPGTLSGVTAIAAGHFHSIALLSDGTVTGWGDNTLFDQITIPSSLTDAIEIESGNFHTIAIDGTITNNHLEAWGSNRFTETFIPSVLSGRTIHQITAGFAHNTLIVENNAPSSINIPDVIEIPEDTPVETILTYLNTNDPDAVDEHIYRLVSGTGSDDNGSFAIMENFDVSTVRDDYFLPDLGYTAVLVNTIEFDYETKNQYKIRIESTDLGGLKVTKQLIINILDVNDEPTLINLSNETILEHQPIGTDIGTFSTEDPDQNDSYTYTLVSGDGDRDNASFQINGDILESSEIFDADTKDTYTIRVRSTDSGGLFVERQFLITVIPTNNPPTDITISNDEILENVPVGTFVGLFSTIDLDPGDIHSYQLVSGNGSEDNAAFTITSNSLLSNVTFDYDVKNEYFIRVRTTDNGDPENQFYEEEFIIKILNYNYPPEITSTSFEVFEDAINGTEVGTVAATDDGTITYEITSGNTNNAFEIHPQTGLISVNEASQLDYATNPSYSLNVMVTDDEGLTASAVIVVIVIGVNNPPLIEDQIFTVREDVTDNAYVASLVATDDRVIVSYDIVEGSIGDALQLNNQNGIITVIYSANLDAEITPSYQFKVKVTDDESLTDEADITINVTEVILAPIVNDQTFSIGENAENNVEVGLVSATDDGTIISFELTSGNTDNVFAINHQSGLITVNDNSNLDYETKSKYTIDLNVLDDDDQITNAVITINIENENDAPDVDAQVFEVKENEDNGFQVGIVRAEDQDGFIESFEIMSGNGDGIYQIDSKVGVITIADDTKLSEGQNVLTVSVTDNVGLTDDAEITINVVNVVGPPIAEDQTFEIEENPNSLIVGFFQATSEHEILFSIESGNKDETFGINSQTGQISVINQANLDAVENPIYTLEIKITDAINSDHTVTAKAFILVKDSNFAPTDITLDGNSIDEQQPSGTKIGDFTTIDPDLIDRHVYTLVSGIGDDDNSSFSILENNLYSARVFSFEDQNILTIRVRSTDDGSPNKYFEKSFTIRINPLPLPEIPTAITPNGDGENDVWVIPNLNLHTQSITKVYDRSGQEVFSSQGYNIPWDGTYNGNDLPIATYYYVIKLNNAAGTSYSGSVTIIR